MSIPGYTFNIRSLFEFAIVTEDEIAFTSLEGEEGPTGSENVQCKLSMKVYGRFDDNVLSR